MIESLARLGWDDDREGAFEPERQRGLEPARVVAQHRGAWEVRTATDERTATLGGRLRYDSLVASDLPAVGDWVGVAGPQIQVVLPRRQVLVRRAPDADAVEQVLAANVETVVIVTSANRDFNLRRLERLVALAWESGGEPLVVVSNGDLVADVDGFVEHVGSVAPGVPVLGVSVPAGIGLGTLLAHLRPGRTVAFVGSSGVGKSTLINALAGREVIRTAEIREDDARGRHTTIGRELHVLNGGWLLIDTPGIREVGLWATEEGLERTFGDIADVAAGCRFGDCRHEHEPGCAVRQAIHDGRLDRARLNAHRKLEREVARVERARDPRARAEEARRWRMIQKSVNAHMTRRYGQDR
ncbi:MAG: ribosome small subunit-dependent GTPase A [Chloroflexi bacterium]|nr:ribosome small subunit-dependent GTPase A [Chloroflexota bacterium]